MAIFYSVWQLVVFCIYKDFPDIREIPDEKVIHPCRKGNAHFRWSYPKNACNGVHGSEI